MKLMLAAAVAMAAISAPPVFAQGAAPMTATPPNVCDATTYGDLGASTPTDPRCAINSYSTNEATATHTPGAVMGSAPAMQATMPTTTESVTSSGMTTRLTANTPEGSPLASYPPCRNRAQDRCRVMSQRAQY